MGVVHKLKKEVVEFVISQKEMNPSIGCRSLVGVVYDKFNIKISKSSINSILKNSRLSSPVGRPAFGKRKASKFHIPEERKKHLFGEHKPVQAKDELLGPKERKDSLSLKAIPEIVVKEAEKEVSAVKDHKEELHRKGTLYDGMGSIFLKAAQWEVSKGSILGGLILRHIKEGEKIDNIEAIGDILFLMHGFGMQNIGELSKYSKEGLFVLSGLKDSAALQDVFRIVEMLEDRRGPVLDFLLDVPQLLKQLAYLKLLLEDGDEIYLDSELRRCGIENAQKGQYVSFSKGLDFLISRVFNNVQSVVLQDIFSEQSVNSKNHDSLESEQLVWPKEFLDMVMTFGDTPGKRIIKGTIYDDEDQEIISLDTVFSKKRSFIASVWPWQREYKYFLKEKENKEAIKSLYNEHVREEIYYQELPFNLNIDTTSLSLRCFLLRAALPEKPFVVLITNSDQDKSPAQDIITDYLIRWPNKQDSFNLNKGRQYREGKSIQEDMVKDEGIEGFYDVSYVCFTILDRHVKTKFFNVGTDNTDVLSIIPACYGLSGYLERNKEFLRVYFDMSGQQPFLREKVEIAVKRINESSIFDYKGRQLILEVC